MIVTISGKAGAGKSSVGKLVAEKMGLRHYSIGDIMRQMAADRGMTLLDLSKKAESDKAIDKELDDNIVRLGKEQDGFVMDGRLTAYFIPHAQVKVFLDASRETRAERILKARRPDEQNEDINQTMRNMEAREQSEMKRYQEYYGVDYLDKTLYNCAIDTNNLSREEVVEKIIVAVKESEKKSD